MTEKPLRIPRPVAETDRDRIWRLGDIAEWAALEERAMKVPRRRRAPVNREELAEFLPAEFSPSVLETLRGAARRGRGHDLACRHGGDLPRALRARRGDESMSLDGDGALTGGA